MEATTDPPQGVDDTHQPAPGSPSVVVEDEGDISVNGDSQREGSSRETTYSHHRFWNSFGRGQTFGNECVLLRTGEFLQYVIPKAKRCNVQFPHNTEFNGPTMGSLLSGARRGGRASNGVGGVVPEDFLPQPAPKADSLWGLFRQSARPQPRLDARVVHPQGFRILKGRSAIERSLRSYFRLPPAPSEHLKRERVLSQRLLLISDMKDDEEDARVFHAAMEGKLKPQQIRTNVTPPNMMLDGFLLLCAGGVPEPDAVKGATLQGSSLVGVISDDMAHFGNLSFLDVSENKLLLEQLLVLTGLEVLHLAYNQITSLAGLAEVVQNSLKRSMGNDSSMKMGPGSTQRGEGIDSSGPENSSIRSAAAYYARENLAETSSTDAGSEKFSSQEFEPPPANVTTGRNTFSGYVRERSPGKVLDHISRIVECSTHDVLLPNLHTLNLSFNRISPSDILHLSYFPSLERLDLSGNKLCKLPDDLAGLTSVTHFALEGNMFRDGENVFRALSTMPALIEVNLNHNKLRRVPPISVKDGHGLCFPSIEVIGLCHNRVERAQDVVALSELQHSLTRVILIGNPIAANKKEQGAVRAHFVQTVLSRYWKQMGLQGSSRSQRGHGSFSPCGTDTLDDIGSSQFQSNVRRGRMRRNDTESEEMPMYERSEGGNQDFSVWNNETKKDGASSQPYRYGDMEDSGENAETPEDGDVGMECFYTSSVHQSQIYGESTQSQSAFSPSEDSCILAGDICWYGDAPMPHSFDKGKATTTTALPSLTNFRVVEFVFDDTVMPKRTAAQFYGKKRSQQSGDVVVSSMVHPRTGLVTVPKHEEYMNVHRLAGTSSHKNSKRPYRTTREKEKRQMAQVLVPTDDDDDVKDADPQPHEVEKRTETTDDETETSSDEGALPQDAVFMTGVALEGKRTKRRKKVEIEDAQSEALKEDVERKEPVQKPETPKPPPQSKQRGPVRPKRRGGARADQAPQMVVEPPGTNARILMNELRRMLRRPLPPLPAVCTTRGGGSKPSGI
ncbi:hypothetical protein, conserved [Trypanosoma brucei gambiense DAL972]|uniref:Leucine-rich repeat protein (LRRP) n=1 Tax=Trypanosoma brucei gambiense (strain MHOM/CI/86/DAL972) TaxID=679716 RepID=D0A097_TRYB9|nr:hypothetical protein, conserved [Trypanosoma brucei gambiense DAL972]CBH16655.1 hypothetical protein, conserved [Trypanosoma brucei gambiense DAL972]|eukprot:XP_011778919.1 hypothetical protein, conserved [Trypanosoma brucei gambiense DAL972]